MVQLMPLQLLQQLQLFNGLFSRTTWVSRYQKGKTNLDFTGARDTEWQWDQLSYMQVCTSLQTDNHASTQPLCFLQAGCLSCHPTNSVKALKALLMPLRSPNPVPSFLVTIQYCFTFLVPDYLGCFRKAAIK